MIKIAWLLAIGILAASASPGLCQVEADVPLINREYSIKALFLYHFSTFTQWPDGKHPATNDPLVIGVFPSDPFGEILDQIAKTKKVGNHSITIRRLATLEGVRDCHILFLRRSVKPDDLKRILEAVRGGSVLVVGETAGFAEQGGSVEFFVEGNKVRFIINVEVTKFEDLKLSSKVLSLARIVPEDKAD